MIALGVLAVVFIGGSVIVWKVRENMRNKKR